LLQRTIGNQEKIPLFPSVRASRAQPLSVHSTQHGIGQPKLAIGPVNDPLERGAEGVADLAVSAAPLRISRKCEECQREERKHENLQMKPAAAPRTTGIEVPAIVRDVLREPGRSLDAETRAFFEPRCGRDFSQVRLHADVPAAASARALAERAYTVGRDIALGPGEDVNRAMAGSW
jgi:hypothetical protein